MLVATAFDLALPFAVERYIEASLQDAGLRGSVDVTSVGLHETRVRRLELREPGATAPQLVVTRLRARYSLSDLLARRVDSFHADTATWRLRAGALERLLGREGEGAALPSTQIDVRTLVVVSAEDGRELVKGRVQVDQHGYIDASLRGIVAGTTADATAHVDRHGSGRIEVVLATSEVETGVVGATGIEGSVILELAGGDVVSARGRARARAAALGALPLGAVDVELDVREATLHATANGDFGRLVVESEVGSSLKLGREVLPFRLDARLQPAIADALIRPQSVAVRGTAPATFHGEGTFLRAGRAWSVMMPVVDVVARFDGGEMNGRKATGLELSAHASALVTPEVAWAALHPGTVVRIERFAVPASSVRAHGVTATLARSGLAVLVRSAAEPWSIAIPELRLRGRELAVAVADRKVVASVDAPVWVRAGSSRVTAGFRAGGHLIARVPNGLPGGLELASQRIELAIAPSSSQPAFDSGHSSFGGSFFATAPVQLGGAYRAVVDTLRMDVRADVVDGRLSLVGLSTALAARDLRWKEVVLASFDGRVEGSASGWSLAGVARLGAEPVFVSATALSDLRKQAVLKVSAPRLAISPAHPLGRLLADHLGVLVRGDLALYGDLAINDGTPSARLTASLVDGRASDLRSRIAAAGVRGRLRLLYDGVLRTDGEQLLQWRELRAGDEVLGAGRARFGLGPKTLEVGEVTAALGKGKVVVKPFSVARSAPRAQVTLALTGLDLRRWLPVVSRGHLRGTGIVDGTLRASVTPDSLSIRTGRLVARSAGRLQVERSRYLEELVRTRLKNANVVSRKVGRRVVAALCDFDYERLALEFFEGKRRPEVRLQVDGHGHRVPQRIELTIDATGVEEVAASALRHMDARTTLAAASPQSEN